MTPGAVLALLADYARERPAEGALLARFRALVAHTPAPFSRAQFEPGHITCSACVLSRDGARVVLLYHGKLARWLQPGGHLEAGDRGPLAAALREVREEAGLAELELLPGPDGSSLLDVDIHPIPARGAEAAHLHYDLRFALRARESERLRASAESRALRWVEVARLAELTDEESVTRLAARAQERARLR